MMVLCLYAQRSGKENYIKTKNIQQINLHISAIQIKTIIIFNIKQWTTLESGQREKYQIDHQNVNKGDQSHISSLTNSLSHFVTPFFLGGFHDIIIYRQRWTCSTIRERFKTNDNNKWKFHMIAFLF